MINFKYFIYYITFISYNFIFSSLDISNEGHILAYKMYQFIAEEIVKKTEKKYLLEKFNQKIPSTIKACKRKFLCFLKKTKISEQEISSLCKDDQFCINRLYILFERLLNEEKKELKSILDSKTEIEDKNLIFCIKIFLINNMRRIKNKEKKKENNLKTIKKFFNTFNVEVNSDRKKFQIIEYILQRASDKDSPIKDKKIEDLSKKEKSALVYLFTAPMFKEASLLRDVFEKFAKGLIEKNNKKIKKIEETIKIIEQDSFFWGYIKGQMEVSPNKNGVGKNNEKIL